MQKPTTILFDWDNTLVDTWPIIHAALVDTFNEMGHEPWTLDFVKQNVKKSMRDSFPELFGENWENAAAIYQNAYRNNHFLKIAGLPHAVEMLDGLVADGITIGVVSNKLGMQLRREIEHMGWNHYFIAIVGASDAPRDKPHADPALMALDIMGLTPSQNIWFIGDTDVDIDCAIAAGLYPVFYGSGEFTDPLNIPDFQLHVKDHQQLIDILTCNTDFR